MVQELRDKILAILEPNFTGEQLAMIDQAVAEALKGCKVESSLGQEEVGSYQFMRLGYFCRDSKSSDKLVFNRSVSLKDGFKKKK